MKDSYQFIYDNAQSILKNEAAIALGFPSEDLRAMMVSHPDVQYWLGCLQQFMTKLQVHNAADHCLENSMHKLLSFDIRETDDLRIPEMNRYILEYMRANTGNQCFFDTINSTIAASWLAYMGHEEQIVIDILCERIEAVYSFTKDRNYDIYISSEGYPAIPSARAMHPFVDPYLYEGNVWKLPTVHDVFAYAHLPNALLSNDMIEKINAIIEYVMDERYQHFHRGYGLMLVRSNKYYSMGWSVHLDHFFECNNRLSIDGVVWAMELMSHFKAARESCWFKNSLRLLEGYGQGEVYEFPAEYLNEGKNKYYVGGGHMGLGEDRKKKKSRKIESTAWMLRILKNCSQSNRV